MKCRGFLRGINPLLMMNRAGHRVFQQVAPGVCMHAAGGGAEPCFYIESAEIGNPNPNQVRICFNVEPEFIPCSSSVDWAFTAEPFGGYDQDNALVPGGNCIVWEVGQSTEASLDASPLDTITLSYTPGGCHKIGESGNDDCLLAAYPTYPVKNSIYGPLSTRIGDIADDIVLVTFPVDNPLDYVGNGFRWSVYFDDVQQFGLVYNIVGGNLQITCPTPATSGTVVTVSHTASTIGEAASGLDGRRVYRFSKMPVFNAIGLSFWNREDTGPWLLDPRGTGRWRLEN